MSVAYRNGRPYVSRPVTWAASTPFPIDLSFLENALRQFKRPVIEHMHLEFTYDITTGVGTPFEQEDQMRVFARTFIKDALGERIDLQGSQLRSVAYHVLGDAYEDPPQIAANLANQTGTIWGYVPFTHPYKLREPDDPALPVHELMSKGEMELTTSAAVVVTGVTINSATIRVHAYVREQVTPEAKSRIKWVDHAVQLLEDNYTVGGNLLAAWTLAQATPGPGFTSWATMTTLDADDLGYSNTLQTYLREHWRNRARGIFANDQLESGVGFPVYCGRMAQSLADLPNLKTMKLTFAGIAVPANSRIVVGVLTDRHAEAVAYMIGADSSDGARAALKSHGKIAGRKGEGYMVADSVMRGRIPVTVAKK